MYMLRHMEMFYLASIYIFICMHMLKCMKVLKCVKNAYVF